ncbi:protein LAZ1 homolog 2 isoform X2 [Amaranthus tricolor]|uniref:protein LAZ1 homolog 2 isoform X2 n=1 Tax=Amaranthus tricolor TaxID=29722 RepID=UPI002586ABD3|nr:protein LAZ1 homolog 2 isoform X2 [Amaranthus tricolor]XP_057545463.1 protein LAZ1 homolog 2 isoform X2 [Amaranthus tricolor]XP_057545464.1 protein LAZ1 homolog 2 isoform X2 [Amaranthus tricolor]XP_057545465.1 protein LAZ1 homolog 2 isoform X2 [Amaranthus tricolor]XP_057545467.1 protein LAZ1 homolog 2 isoform X2 [Amaranthus tricolor]
MILLSRSEELGVEDVQPSSSWCVGLASLLAREMTAYRELYGPAIIIAGFFALFASVLSLILIFKHLRLYTNPAEQKWIVGVLFMVPIYATESIISLSNPKTSLACDILRNCYEAFALYAFGSYLIACLGGEDKVLELLGNNSRKSLDEPLLEGDTEEESLWKTCRNFFRQPSALGEKLFSIIKFGLVQYMILKTVCAFLAFILEICGVYGDGQFKWYYGYPYITVVLNFSQMWALYCLVQFYNVTHERLKPIRPLAKFISFKAIVFATWWQGVGIALLCTLKVFPKGKIQTGLQDFLICIEMAIAAIAHIFVFSTKPYNFVTVTEYGRISTQTEKKIVSIKEEGKEKGPAMIEKTETEIKAPGTSITESVQDIVMEGGHQVVEDVKLTINQAIEPVEKGVEKGVTKIQDSFHQITVGSDGKQESDMEIEEHVENEKSGDEVCVASEKLRVAKTVNETSNS